MALETKRVLIAWFMLQRIRLAMQNRSFEKIAGEFEADESFIGGLARNMHKGKKAKITGTGGAGKAVVMGLLDRKTRKIRLAHLPNTQIRTAPRLVLLWNRIESARMLVTTGPNGWVEHACPRTEDERA